MEEKTSDNAACVQNTTREVESNSCASAPSVDVPITCSTAQPEYPPPPYEMPSSPAVPYPQPYAAPHAGFPYAPPAYTPLQPSPQPGFTYPSYTTPYYPPSQPQQQQQQQQQQAVIVNGQQQQPQVVRNPTVVVQRSYVSMVGTIAFSCFVFWFCCVLFGGIAFILAMVGQSASNANNPKKARSMRNASLGISSAGVALGAVFIAVVVFLGL